MARITLADACYLLRELPLDGRTRATLESLPVQFVEYLNPEQVDALRDMCGERLQEVGFGLDYSLTDEGRLLEELIDKLFLGGTGSESGTGGDL